MLFFKTDYETEHYLSMPLSYKYRSAIAKFRCGVAPIRLETGRYENIPEDLRLCPLCRESVENEEHVLLHCQAYLNTRNELYEKANDINSAFDNLSDID